MYSLANELFSRCYQRGGVALSSMSAAERARAIAEFMALRMEGPGELVLADRL
jgi:hypothetical protein